MVVNVQADDAEVSKCLTRRSGTELRSSSGEERVPPLSRLLGRSPTGPASTTEKPRDWPRRMIGPISCSSWREVSSSVPTTAASRSLASAASRAASERTTSTRFSTRPSRVCWSRNQPTTLTTIADSSTVLTTIRAWIERRQKVSPRRMAAVGLRAATGTYAVPALYPTPRTVTTISGFSGSCSTFERSRCTCTLTSRVSAACR